MLRDSNIPLFLWIAAAVLVHLTWKDGAERASQVIEERLDLQRFAASVQQRVRLEAQPFEVTLQEAQPLEPSRDSDTGSAVDEEAEADQPDPLAQEQAPKPEELAKNDPEKKLQDRLPPEEKRPEPAPKLEQEKDKKKEAEDEKKQAEQLPPVALKNRIAVQQHVKDKEQADNPDAEFLADQANRVKEQTQARITSSNQNEPDPTPGANFSGPSAAPGNSDQSRVAQDEDSPGVEGHAPNERTGQTEGTVASAPAPASTTRAEGENQPGKQAAEREARVARNSELPGQRAAAGQAAMKGVQGAPDLSRASDGNESVAEARTAARAEAGRKPQKRRLPPPKSQGGVTDMLGFGAAGTTRSGINLNLSPSNAVAAIGMDKLANERRADAQRRRSEHLGSWRSTGIERWRAAIENYVSSVKPGNQTALNTARVPFASYLNVIHNRLHPIFADSFLGSLSSLPSSHPMNQDNIRTNLEIVLSKEDGRVVRMGVTRTSGVTAFDIAALESVQRASPFGPPPPEIVSPDGNVYFHWEFYRNPFYACSTYFARPYILKAQPKSAPPSVDPPAPTEPGSGERGSERHGHLLAPGSTPVVRVAVVR